MAYSFYSDCAVAFKDSEGLLATKGHVVRPDVWVRKFYETNPLFHISSLK